MDGPHNAAGVDGARDGATSADYAGFEARAAAFGSPRDKLKRREARLRRRDKEVARLIEEGKRVALDTSIPSPAKGAHLLRLLKRADKLRRANLDQRRTA